MAPNNAPNGWLYHITTISEMIEWYFVPRLHAPEHGFRWEDDDNRVWHPDPAGTIIGKVTEWFNESDLGLVSLFEGIGLDNDNFGSDAEFRLPSRKLKDGDTVTIDSSVSGRQVLISMGVRFQKRTNGLIPGRDKLKYFVLQQGIYANSEPIISNPPKTRLGMCAVPLIMVDSANIENARGGGWTVRFAGSTYEATSRYCYFTPKFATRSSTSDGRCRRMLNAHRVP